MEIRESGIFAYPKGRALLLRGSTCNVFAVPQPDGRFVLIDTGVSVFGRAKKLKTRLSQDGLELGTLQAIVLTHAHPDHMNALPYLLEEAPQCEVWVHALDAPFLRDPGMMWDFGETVVELKEEFLPFGAFGLARTFAEFGMGASRGVEPTHVFENGAVIGSGCGALEAIHTPGHTPGHSCFYLGQRHLLFIGDLFDPTFNHRPSVNLPTCALAETMASHRRLRGLDIETLATAHGDEAAIVISGRDEVTSAVEQSLAHLRAGHDNVIGFLEANESVRLRDLQACIPSDVWKAKYERIIVAWVVLRDLMEAGQVKREGRKFSLRNT